MTGTLSFACTRLPTTYQPDQVFIDSLTAFTFSKKIIQYRCSTCSAFVLCSSKLPKAEHEEQKLSFDVMTGTLEKLDGNVDLRGHIYVSDTQDGGFADFLTTFHGKKLPRWTAYHDQDTQTPLGWRVSPLDVRSSSGEKLHAHCKCDGIQFWIKRASGSNNGEQRPKASASGPMCSPELADWLRADCGKYLAWNCVCNSCRLATGMEVTQWAYVKTADLSLDQDGKQPFSTQFGTLKTYNTSPGVTRSSCSVCGAMAFFCNDDDARDGFINVGVGLLDAPEGARAERWLEWRLERLGYQENAAGRAESLAAAIEGGCKQFQHRQE